MSYFEKLMPLYIYFIFLYFLPLFLSFFFSLGRCNFGFQRNTSVFYLYYLFNKKFFIQESKVDFIIGTDVGYKDLKTFLQNNPTVKTLQAYTRLSILLWG
jgi:hypothetical protein